MKEIKRNNQSTRSISIGLKLKIWFSNVMVIMGAAFILMGIPFVLVFVPFGSLLSPDFSDDDPIVEARITYANSTNASINEEEVYKYSFTYNTPDGGTYSNVGYSTGQYYGEGDTIIVRYKSNKPSISKAEELRESSFPPIVSLFTLIFPLIGLIMFFFGAKKSLNSIRILKIGEVAYGIFLHKEPTNTKINEQTVYKLTFEFTAKDNKTYKTISKTHKYQRLLDEEKEKLVYDPNNPENAVLLDALPKTARKYFENIS